MKKNKPEKLNMRHLLTTTILLLALSLLAQAQINYSGKFEAGYMKFQYNTVQVEPGPYWKGDYLNDNGIDINFINGLTFVNKKLFAGLGLGYLNFTGTNGVSLFADLEYLPLKTKLTPLLNVKLGYNHIWNQYEGGTGTMHTEFGIGLNYKLTEKFGLYLKSGMLYTQQSFLIPITIGFRY